IEDIIVRGNTKTKDYVITRELLVKEGEIFNARKIRRSQEKIYNLGFFKTVNLDIKPGSAEGLMNLIIEVEEQLTGLITLGIVYGTVDGWGGYEEVSENNLFGRGIRIHERIEYQQYKQNYEVGMSYPWIFGSPNTFSLSVFYRNNARIRTTSIKSNEDIYYNKQEWGSTVGLARRMSDTITLSSFYGIELYKYYRFRPVSEFGTTKIPSNLSLQEKMHGQDRVKSSLTLKFDYDSRDNVFNPTSGLHFNQSWSMVGGFLGGNDKYMKYITDVSKYYPLFWRFVLVLHLNLGLIDRSFDGKPIDNTINSDDLLYVGGVESIRGYDYWDAQWKYGGFSRVYGNVEYRYPIAEQIIWGVFFMDGGHLWEKTHLINFNIKEYYFSAGWGFRIQIPMIPIRLYFSKRFFYDEFREEWILLDKTISSWQFDFSVGGLF
ncbi:MAG: BamA/TamA family outer membrane protein, partial [Spirochaetes bacterium]|nr:BamA/TamA family outer membrane protein [Spirochaetota bacterium]